MSPQKDPNVIKYEPSPVCIRLGSIALYGFPDDDDMPVLPRSVHEPASIVVDVA